MMSAAQGAQGAAHDALRAAHAVVDAVPAQSAAKHHFDAAPTEAVVYMTSCDGNGTFMLVGCFPTPTTTLTDTQSSKQRKRRQKKAKHRAQKKKAASAAVLDKDSDNDNVNVSDAKDNHDSDSTPTWDMSFLILRCPGDVMAGSVLLSQTPANVGKRLDAWEQASVGTLGRFVRTPLHVGKDIIAQSAAGPAKEIRGATLLFQRGVQHVSPVAAIQPTLEQVPTFALADFVDLLVRVPEYADWTIRKDTLVRLGCPPPPDGRRLTAQAIRWCHRVSLRLNDPMLCTTLHDMLMHQALWTELSAHDQVDSSILANELKLAAIRIKMNGLPCSVFFNAFVRKTILWGEEEEEEAEAEAEDATSPTSPVTMTAGDRARTFVMLHRGHACLVCGAQDIVACSTPDGSPVFGESTLQRALVVSVAVYVVLKRPTEGTTAVQSAMDKTWTMPEEKHDPSNVLHAVLAHLTAKATRACLLHSNTAHGSVQDASTCMHQLAALLGRFLCEWAEWLRVPIPPLVLPLSDAVAASKPKPEVINVARPTISDDVARVLAKRKRRRWRTRPGPGMRLNRVLATMHRHKGPTYRAGAEYAASVTSSAGAPGDDAASSSRRSSVSSSHSVGSIVSTMSAGSDLSAFSALSRLSATSFMTNTPVSSRGQRPVPSEAPVETASSAGDPPEQLPGPVPADNAPPRAFDAHAEWPAVVPYDVLVQQTTHLLQRGVEAPDLLASAHTQARSLCDAFGAVLEDVCLHVASGWRMDSGIGGAVTSEAAMEAADGRTFSMESALRAALKERVDAAFGEQMVGCLRRTMHSQLLGTVVAHAQEAGAWTHTTTASFGDPRLPYAHWDLIDVRSTVCALSAGVVTDARRMERFVLEAVFASLLMGVGDQMDARIRCIAQALTELAEPLVALCVTPRTQEPPTPSPTILSLADAGVDLQQLDVVNVCDFRKCPRHGEPMGMGELKKCGQCRVRQYCGRQCQTLHWPVHKRECAKLTRFRL